MLTWELLLGLVMLGMVAVYWRQALIAKEHAERTARQRCRALELQFLDESVSLSSIWLKRNSSGHLRFWRTYQFEFTATGVDRALGQVQTLGSEIIAIEVGAHRIH